MIARLFSAAMRAIDAGGSQSRREIRREQQKIHAEARVAAESSVVHPKRVDALAGMQMPRGIDPSLLEEPAERRTCFRLHHCVEPPQPFVVDVGFGRDHVEIARQHHRLSGIHQCLRVRVQALEPGKLEIEFRSGLGVAVRQVHRGDDQAVDLRLQVARLLIQLVARQAAADLRRLLALREDRNPVVRALAVPDRTVARVLQRARRTLLVGGLDFLQADDVGSGLVQPFEQPRQPAVDAVDVIARDLQANAAMPV